MTTQQSPYDYDSALRRRLQILDENNAGYQSQYFNKLNTLNAAKISSSMVSDATATDAVGNDLRSKIVATAAKYNGVPYVWGGKTPKGFDCSGLVQYVYKSMGFKVPPGAIGQASTMGKVAPLNSLRPGDLVAWGSSPANAHHIAIYAGNGQIWEAPRPGANVRLTKISGKDAFGISVSMLG